MGFFVKDEDILKVRRQPAPPKEKRTIILDPSAVGCNECPLKATWSHIATPQMRMTGTVDADVLVLGEAPGEDEDREGSPFVGKSGKLLRETIPRGSWGRVAYQNTVRCRPDNNTTPSIHEVHACSPYLQADIAALPKLKAILGVGSVPLQYFFPGASITRVNGNKFAIRVGSGASSRIIWYYPIMHPSYVLRKADEEKRNKGSRQKPGGYGNAQSYGPVYPVFQADIIKFFRQLDKWEKPRIANMGVADVMLPKSYNEAMQYIDRMHGRIVGVDIESIGLRPYLFGARILVAAISDGETTIAFPCDHPEEQTDWGLELLLWVVCNMAWVAQNAAMEYSWLKWFWPDAPVIIPEDSMACGRLYHERETILSLELLSRFHLGVNIKSLSNVDAARIMIYPLSEVVPYCGLDAKACVMIYNLLRPQINTPNYERIIRAVASTTQMELDGLPVDLEMSARLRQYWKQREIDIKVEISKLYEVRAWEADTGKKFNVQSPEHVGDALVRFGKVDGPRELGLTKNKQWVTDEEHLLPLVDTQPLAKLTLESRETSKMDSTYIEPILEVPHTYVDGLLHPTYTVMFVSTQRLSSRNPNIQNFPRTHGTDINVRQQVIAPPGYIIVKFDYGQLEVRVLAMASLDRRLIENIIKKVDMHAYWRDYMFKIYPDYIEVIKARTGETEEKAILKAARDEMKSDFVFSTFYGGSAASCVARTRIPLPEVTEALAELWRQYPGIPKWHKVKRNEYRDTGRSTTLTGRIRHAVMLGNEPINNPIQGTAADIVIDAMNDISELARSANDPHLRPRINVHDDITFMLPDNSELPNYVETIKDVLIKKRYRWQVVPLTVEMSIGKNWGQFEPVCTFEGDYYR